MGRRASRGPAARGDARQAFDAALQAGQEHARMEGARRGQRRARRRIPWRSWPRAAPFRRRTTTTSTRFSRRRSRRAAAFGAHDAPPPVPELPVADVRAFSIDDATTTEVDDAFSVRELPNGHYEIGIHIAAPALGIRARLAARRDCPRAALDGLHARPQAHDVARCRRRAFTLAEGRSPPALSLYAEVSARRRRSSGTKRGSIACRSPPICVSTRSTPRSPTSCPRRPIPRGRTELRVLWKFAQRLSEARGKADFARIDYSFQVDWDRAVDGGERGYVRIVPRPRGSPLDKLISELMIFVNSAWGKLLADAHVAGLYRTQVNGKVKMSTRPGEHQGLGLAHYLWSSSPLRRYSDLVNQRQLQAAIEGTQAAVCGQRCRALRRAHRFRSDLRELRRVPGPDGALLVPALARCRSASRETTGAGHPRHARPLRSAAARRAAAGPSVAACRDARVRIAIGRIDLLAATLECRYAGVRRRAGSDAEARPRRRRRPAPVVDDALDRKPNISARAPAGRRRAQRARLR